MARARNIKPSLFKNEVLGVADPIYTLLFEGLWILADREGRLEDRPLRIRGEIFPYRDGIDMEAMLGWLQTHGFIRRYEAEGKRCILVLEFVKHQNPHKNEAPSDLPAPIGRHAEHIGATPEKIGSTRADSLSSDSLSLIPDTPAPAPPPPPAAHVRPKPDLDAEAFEAAWCEYPTRPGHSKAQAFKAWTARIRDGESVGQMLDGVRRYAAFCTAQRTEARFIKHAATFFGPDKHYLSDWTPPARAGPGTSPSETAYQRSLRERAERMTGGLVSAKPPTSRHPMEVIDAAP